MKKIFTISFVLLIAASSVSALSVNAGPKASVSGTHHIGGTLWEEAGKQNGFGINGGGGGFINVLFSPLFGIQLELLPLRGLTLIGREFGPEPGTNETYDVYKEIHILSSIPFYLRFNFDLGKVKVYTLGGAGINFLIGEFETEARILQGSNKGATGSKTPADTKFERIILFNFGLGAGVSIPTKTGTWELGLNYSGMIGPRLKGVSVSANHEDSFWGTLALEVAYSFELSSKDKKKK